MRIWLDRDRLAAYGLTVQDIEDAMRRRTSRSRPGASRAADREFTVLSQTGLTTPEQFATIIVKDADGFQVKLGDLAKVEIGAERGPQRHPLQRPQLGTIGIIKQATANPLDVARARPRRAAGA